MWIFVAEAMGALGLFLFIVWWTLGPTQRREQETLRTLAREEAERGAKQNATQGATHSATHNGLATHASVEPRTADPPD